MPIILLLCLLALWPRDGKCAGVPAYSVEQLLAAVPPLAHDARGRLPLITWEPLCDGIPTAATCQALTARGLALTIRLDPSSIPLALAIQQAGMPVVAMEGNGGDNPGALGPDALHHPPADYKLTDTRHPCPLLLTGWQLQADTLRATLKRFKDAGVTLDAAWLDWENEPIWGEEEWEQSRHCSRCQAQFPPGVLASYPAYRDFIVRYRQGLFSTYLAAPIREAYPQCSVTNWAVVYSSAARPTLHYWGRFHFPPLDVGLFTATNPVAYGNDIYYKLHWQKLWTDPAHTPLDVPHMDRLYTAIMLAQVSDNAANALRMHAETQCVPWVCRYCPDEADPHVPMLSRARYRELLRHIWLRGATSLQVFNAARTDHPELRIEEVADAVASYDEALRYRPLLEHGTVMCTDVPGVESHGPIWSGLRDPSEAIIRAFTQDPTTTHLTLSVWDDTPALTFDAPPEGAYYHVVRDGNNVRVERE